MYCKLGLCHVFIVYCNIFFLYFQNIPNQFQQRNLLNSACLIWFIQWLWLFFWLIVVSIVLFYDLNIMQHALRRKCVTQSGVEKLYNNTHQTQTKVGQMTDQYTHIIERTLDIYFQQLIQYMLPYLFHISRKNA